MNSPAGGGLPLPPLPTSRPHKEKGRREKNGMVAMAGGGASKNNEEQEEEEGGGSGGAGLKRQVFVLEGLGQTEERRQRGTESTQVDTSGQKGPQTSR